MSFDKEQLLVGFQSFLTSLPLMKIINISKEANFGLANSFPFTSNEQAGDFHWNAHRLCRDNILKYIEDEFSYQKSEEETGGTQINGRMLDGKSEETRNFSGALEDAVQLQTFT